MEVKHLDAIILDNVKGIPSLSTKRTMTYGVVMTSLIHTCKSLSEAQEINKKMTENGGKYSIVITIKSNRNWYTKVNQNSKEIPGKTVRVGKRYKSGLVRCECDGKTYIIHEKFLISK